MKDLTLLEEIVLTTIVRLEDNAYGVSIRLKVAEVTGKNILYGTLFNALEQLLRKGLIVKTKGLPVAERGGRSRMYFHLTKDGHRALAEARQLRNLIWNGLPEPEPGRG
jgi:PadR family transcriptional regulator PadR